MAVVPVRLNAYELVHRVAGEEVASVREFFATRPPSRSRRGSVGAVVKSFTVFPFYLGTAALLMIGLVTT